MYCELKSRFRIKNKKLAVIIWVIKINVLRTNLYCCDFLVINIPLPRDARVCFAYNAPTIFSGTTALSNSSLVMNPKARIASFNVVFSAYAFFATLDALSYPMCWFNAVTSMSELRKFLSNWSRLAFIPATQLRSKARAASASNLHDCRALNIITGL